MLAPIKQSLIHLVRVTKCSAQTIKTDDSSDSEIVGQKLCR